MNKAPISVRIINVLSHLAFWVMIFITGAAFIVNIIILSGDSFGSNFQLRIQLPVTFDVLETGSVELFGNANDIRLESAKGQVHLVDTPERFSRIIVKLVFFVSLLGLFITWKFKLFISNINKGNIFLTDNINNLKHIAYTVLALWLTTKIYLTVLYKSIFQFADFSSVRLNEDITEGSGLIIAALLIWILAHVFMKGVEMKEEQDLTI